MGKLFEKPLKLEGFEERLIQETEDLKGKVNKLNDFMRTKEFYDLGREEKDLMYSQYKAMLDYLRILGKRLELRQLKLKFEEE